jgi:hypothetical protein
MIIAFLTRKFVLGSPSLRRRADLHALTTGVRQALNDSESDSQESSVAKQLLADIVRLREELAAGQAPDPEKRLANLRRRYDLFFRWRTLWRAVKRLPDDHPLKRSELPRLRVMGEKFSAKDADLVTLSIELDDIEEKLRAGARAAIEQMAQEAGEGHRERALNYLRACEEILSPDDIDLTSERLREAEPAAAGGDKELLPRLRLPAWPSLIGRLFAFLHDSVNGWRIAYVGGVFLAWVVLLIVSVAGGVLILYEADPAWGNWQTVVAAFLWGAGLHAVGGVSFQGLLSKREQIGAPPPAPH